jgi:hypothetical protein
VREACEQRSRLEREIKSLRSLRFRTVVARGEAPVYFQVWVLSNGREFILVTHTCDREPTPDEIAEANEIALMTGYI